MASLQPNLPTSFACPTPLIQTGLSVSSLAFSSEAKTTAANMSLTRLQSRNLIGQARGLELSTSSTVIFMGPWALGFNMALPWFFTETLAACAGLMLYNDMYAWQSNEN